jgi:hypothetical protein
LYGILASGECSRRLTFVRLNDLIVFSFVSSRKKKKTSVSRHVFALESPTVVALINSYVYSAVAPLNSERYLSLPLN